MQIEALYVNLTHDGLLTLRYLHKQTIATTVQTVVTAVKAACLQSKRLHLSWL